MKKNYKLYILIYVVLFLLCVVVVYGLPSLKGMMVRTYITERGEINITDETTGYIIRDEVVYKAGKAGSVKRVADAGRLIKAGTKVVDISGAGAETSLDKSYPQLMETLGKKAKETKAGKSQTAGYVSYRIDGAEGALTKKRAVKMRKSRLEELARASLTKCARGKCAKGDPVFKVTKNGKWYLIVFLNDKDAERYIEGYTVTVDINGKTIDADVKSVTKLKKDPGLSRIVLSCGMFYQGYLTDRAVDVVITTAGDKGLLVENGSIVEKGGQKGVLVKNKLGKYVFKPIKIKADNGERCVVCQDIFMDEESNYVETLKIYDEIVTSPSEEDVKNAE